MWYGYNKRAQAYTIGIEYYRCTGCTIEGKRFVEVVARCKEVFFVTSVCDVDKW
jgi:hypothetical protein